MDISLNTIHLGDSLEVLKTFPDESLDSCITDPPYGLGSKEPTVEEIISYLAGESVLKMGGDFKNADWDIPSVALWKEVHRVLKPGGHVTSFGGTRTWDLISLGLRAAGFTLRDTVADNHPGLQWIYASGMPKSSNLAMNADKALGHTFDSKNYSPISEEAKSVVHLGSGLKPSWEPILVFRKPFKGNLVDNVLLHGTGAYNIDGTRVKHSSPADFEAHRKQVEAIRTKGGVREDSWKNSSDLSGAKEVTTSGRWPANAIFCHTPACGSGGCHPDCPVARLDAQSGDRPSTLTGRADPTKSHAHPGTELNPNSSFLGERTHHSNVYADSGGASRFFMSFQLELEEPFLYVPKANRMAASMGEFKVKHPTLKPISLMSYLIRLVTPRGGTVLDPFCGSGSTCHAALLEGCSYVGIERDPANHAEALERLAVIHRRVNEETLAEEMFDYALGGSNS